MFNWPHIIIYGFSYIVMAILTISIATVHDYKEGLKNPHSTTSNGIKHQHTIDTPVEHVIIQHYTWVAGIIWPLFLLIGLVWLPYKILTLLTLGLTKKMLTGFKKQNLLEGPK